MTACIYKLTNKINNKIYIGQTIDFDYRIYCHFNKNNTTGRKLKNAIKKYGKENFLIAIVESFDLSDDIKDMLNQREQYYLDLYKPFGKVGYNLQKHSLRTNLGTKMPNWVREKVSNGLKKYHKTHDNAFKGRKHSDETKKLLSIASKGRKHTEEFKKKMSELNKKTNRIHILNKWKLDNGHPRLTPIIQVYKDGSFIKIFGSIKEASLATGIGGTSIINCLSELSKSAGGYKWEYFD